MNTQPIEKQNLRDDGYLSIINVFYTIQGEGPYAGTPAVFIRLAGCNLQCPMCDTDYTSRPVLVGPNFAFDLIQEQLGPAKLVVITGGEPFRQNITPLVELLLDAGIRVQIETNGTLYLEGFPYHEVAIICSPKTGKLNSFLIPEIDAYKYVMASYSIVPQDGLPQSVLNHPVGDLGVARPPAGSKVFLQPVDTGNEEENNKHRQWVIKSCMQFGYTLCLQIHKIINME